MRRGRDIPVDAKGAAAVEKLQTARKEWAEELRRMPASPLFSQLNMVHLTGFAGVGDSVVAAHRQLLSAFSPQQVSEISVTNQPYLGHWGQFHIRPSTNFWIPFSLAREMVLTGGSFGDCHYRNFLARIDQRAEAAFLLGQREELTFHLVGNAIYRLVFLKGKVHDSFNLHQCRERRAAGEYSQLAKALSDYTEAGNRLQPEYALPIEVRVHQTAERYLQTL